MKSKFRNKNDREAEDDNLMSEGYLPFAERAMQSIQMIVPIDEPVKNPSYYRHVVERMQQLSPDDSIKFSINSGGGRLDGLLTMLDAINTTEADTIAEIVGECHSAASILALNCDYVLASPYAGMLVHNVQFGAVGSGSDVRDMVHHTLDFSEKLFLDTYAGFLTEDEIQEVFNGREMWLQAEEIQRRLILKTEYLTSLNEEEVTPEPETEPEEVKVKPKKKTKS